MLDCSLLDYPDYCSEESNILDGLINQYSLSGETLIMAHQEAIRYGANATVNDNGSFDIAEIKSYHNISGNDTSLEAAWAAGQSFRGSNPTSTLPPRPR